MLLSIFILGLALGSFLNAYIFRTQPSPPPKSSPLKGEEAIENSPPLVGGVRGGGKDAWHGRSQCPKCRKPLAWYELIPLLSFALQRGRCRGCKQRIDWQYPMVELVTGILFVLARLSLGSTQGLALGVSWYLLVVLVILFVYDLRYGLVPDRVVLPAIGVATLYTVILSRAKDLFTMQGVGSLHSARASVEMTIGVVLLAILIGAGFFWLQYVLSRGRWLGAGDIRIGALMGAMLGWPFVLVGLVISYIIGGAVALLLIVLRKKQFGQTLPLGAFLTVGTVIVFLYGEQIWNWYWRM